MIRPAALALALASLAAPALSQDNPGGGWAFALGGATDNRSKSVSKSDGDPYGFGLAEWESADGFFYGGPAFETIKGSHGSELELELGGGIRPEWAGFDIDLNAVHKWQVDANPGVDDDAWEFTANISRSIGPANARLQVQHSPDGTGATEAWTWVAGRVGWDFTERLAVDATLGRREQDNAPDYTGWDVGGTYALTPAIELELRYFGNDAPVNTRQYADTLVAGFSVAF